MAAFTVQIIGFNATQTTRMRDDIDKIMDREGHGDDSITVGMGGTARCCGKGTPQPYLSLNYGRDDLGVAESIAKMLHKELEVTVEQYLQSGPTLVYAPPKSAD